MVRAGVFLLVAIAGMPQPVAGQAWADAYAAGDYARAAELLHPIVLRQQMTIGSEPAPDPAPARLLSAMYARGTGVVRDPSLACALARLSDLVRDTVHVPLRTLDDVAAYNATLEESEQFVRTQCEPLTDGQRQGVQDSMACLAFGLRDDVVFLGQQPVAVGRDRSQMPESAIGVSLDDLGCPGMIVRLQARTLEPPPDAAPGVTARAFLELVAWQAPDPFGKRPEYGLIWRVFELRRTRLVTVVMEPHSSAIWPTALPPDFDARLHVEMIRSGHVRWRLDGAPPRRGWIMRPEGDER